MGRHEDGDLEDSAEQEDGHRAVVQVDGDEEQPGGHAECRRLHGIRGVLQGVQGR